MTSIIFVDTEGCPIQEMSAIEMDKETEKIVDVYHEFANIPNPEVDWYSSKYIHGLQPAFLAEYGFQNQIQLTEDFKLWLMTKSVHKLYANDPTHERGLLKPYVVEDLRLPIWKERVLEDYHEIAQNLKERNIPFFSTTNCFLEAHSNFRPLTYFKNYTHKLKSAHGFHCCLYDVYELYLYYRMDYVKEEL